MLSDHSISDKKLKFEILKLLYISIPTSQIGNLLVAIILVILLRDFIAIPILTGWFVFLFFSITYRFTVRHSFNKALIYLKPVEYKKWENKFILGVILTALSWGAAGILLYPDDVVRQVYLELTLAGIGIASIGTLSPSFKALLIFIPITLLPVAINSFVHGNAEALPLTGMIVIYIGVSLVSGKKFNQNLIENLQLHSAASKKELELQESEEKYRLLYEKSEDPMIVIKGNHFSMANEAAVRLFGYKSQRRILTTPPFDFSPKFQNDGQSSIEKARHVMSIVQKTGYYRFEWDYKRLNGEVHPADITLTSIPYRGDRAVFCIIRDITKNKDIEHKLIQEQQKAQAANNAKSDFLANMSHEIRTPMNGVLGTTNILLQYELSAAQKVRALTIKNSAESMLNIVNDILDFSKVEAGKLDLELRAFDMEHLIKEFSSSVINRITQKKIKFISLVKLESQRWYKGDSGRIRQILTNLIDNAIKFTEAGSITVKCKIIKKSKTYSFVQFEIIDTGIGISNKQQQKIFQRFSQGDSSTTRRYGGTGLGLSICQQLAVLMGGDISFASKKHKGTKFWFTVKLENISQRPQISQSNNFDIKKINAKILIVDDNTINQLVAQGMLEVYGLDCHIASNGIMALKMLNEDSYDLVLMDCHMPIMDGYEATRKIRLLSGEKLNHNIPVIAMTASAMRGDREKCLAAGMNDYIAKPIDAENLQSVLLGWLPQSSHKQIQPSIESKKAINGINNKVYDYTAVHTRLAGNEELVKTITIKFINSIKNHIENLKQNVRVADIDKVIAAAHKLKGSAATIGCIRLSELAYEIEQAGYCKDIEKIHIKSSQLLPCYILTKTTVEKKLALV